MYDSSVVNAKYVGDYVVWVEFSDGTEGRIDLSSELSGEIFEPLKNIDYFKQFKIKGRTLSWDNGADFAPEFLRKRLDS